MNLAITRSEDPYIQLGNNHWNPYIELLIRSGIAVKHSKDGKKMKLIEFHI